jgi:hypothetical protein
MFMRVKLLGIDGTWRAVANAANTTIHREDGTREPTSRWKQRMLMCEHSPIRKLNVSWRWYDLKYWVSTHLVRHKFGIEHFVRSQRTDRTGIDRNDLPQGNLVEHECEANAQAIINISRKRLCKQASKETRRAWQEFLNSFKDEEPELFNACVPECVYRNGLCPEFKTCGWNHTQTFKQRLAQYVEGFEKQISNMGDYSEKTFSRF